MKLVPLCIAKEMITLHTVYSPLSIQTGRLMGKKTVIRLAIVSKGSKFGEKRPLEVERLTDCYVLLGRHELGTKISDFANFWSLFDFKIFCSLLGCVTLSQEIHSVMFQNCRITGGGKKSQLLGSHEHSNGTSTIHGTSMSYWKRFFACWIYLFHN